MKEDKKLIMTITDGGKPAFATECKLFAGVALMDDVGHANGIVLGHANILEMASTTAALYALIEDIEGRYGPEFKTLVKKARAMGVRRND